MKYNNFPVKDKVVTLQKLSINITFTLMLINKIYN